MVYPEIQIEYKKCDIQV